MTCVDCGSKTAGKRCRRCDEKARRLTTAQRLQIDDFALLLMRADHKSLADIGRHFGFSRQRAWERLWIAAGRQGIRLANLHPATVKAAFDLMMSENTGGAIRALQPDKPSGSILAESGGNEP